MDNLEIYNKVRAVPVEAQKEIKGGNINGFTDINPMWRIKTLTELFGPCGIGWFTEILKQWIEIGADGRTAAFCNINLYVNTGVDWSKPIFGTGGSMFVDLAKGAQKSSDECYKMAYTDAISVACKQLGIGADVYWDKDACKYDKNGSTDNPETKPLYYCEECKELFKPFEYNGKNYTAKDAFDAAKEKRGSHICGDCFKKLNGGDSNEGQNN